MPVGDGGGEAEVLLDQQDGEARASSARGSTSPIAARSPAPGPRSARRAAACRRRCAGCGRSPASAARRPTACVPWAAAAAPSGWEKAGRSRRSTCRPAAPRAAAAGSPRHVRLEKMPRSSGTVADAQARDLVRRHGRSAPARAAGSSPVRLRHDAHDRAQGRGLAGAVAAEQRHRLRLRARRRPTPCRTWISPYQACRSSISSSAVPVVDPSGMSRPHVGFA